MCCYRCCCGYRPPPDCSNELAALREYYGRLFEEERARAAPGIYRVYKVDRNGSRVLLPIQHVGLGPEGYYVEVGE